MREAVTTAQKFAHESTLEGCDVSDIDEICSPLQHELDRPLPNAQTLATYMNSLVRSLRSQHHSGQIVARLLEVMSKAGLRVDL